MKFGILGAGAVGSYFGAKLSQAGVATVFLGRDAFVSRVAHEGLRLRSGGTETVIPIEASTDYAALSDVDVVLCCVKSAGTEAAGRQLAPHLKTEATVISFQNGFDNADRLGAELGRTVVPAAVYVAVEVPVPGEVIHHGRGDLVIGASPTSEPIAAVLRQAGVPTTVSDRVQEVLWSKLITNCAFNALSALAELPYGPLLAVEGVAPVMADAIRECEAVGRGIGLDLPAVDVDAILAIVAQTMPGQYSSTAQDVMRGRPSEIDFLNGYVVRRGAEIGIPTPANRALHVMIKLLEVKAAARPEKS